MIRNTLFINNTDILTRMNLSIKILTFSKMAHVAIMCPLLLCPRLPLWKPFCFPTGIQSFKSQPESTYSGKQLTYCFLHKSSLIPFQSSHALSRKIIPQNVLIKLLLLLFLYLHRLGQNMLNWIYGTDFDITSNNRHYSIKLAKNIFQNIKKSGTSKNPFPTKI